MFLKKDHKLFQLRLFLLLLCVSIISTGCFGRYPIENAIQRKIVINPNGQLLPVGIDGSGEVDEVKRLEYRDKVRDLLTKDGYDFIFYDETENNIYSHRVKVQIDERNFGGAGMSLFTGLSLGIIPSLEYRDDIINVEVTLFEGEDEIDNLKFSADLYFYGGLAFIPFSFLNQTDLDVISDEIRNVINTIISNHNIAVELIGEKTPEVTTDNVTNETTTKNIEYLTQQIRSPSLETRIIAAKKIVRGGKIVDTKIYNIINDYILRNYKSIKKDGHSVDEIAWFCKALSTSGQAVYKETLYEVYKNCNSMNLRRHAKNSLNFVDDYAEGKIGFNMKFIDYYR